jgi:hypothetical protein
LRKREREADEVVFLKQRKAGLTPLSEAKKMKTEGERE